MKIDQSSNYETARYYVNLSLNPADRSTKIDEITNQCRDQIYDIGKFITEHHAVHCG